MNGTLAAIFLTSSLFDPEISLVRSTAPIESAPYQAVGLAKVEFQKKQVGNELNWMTGSTVAYGPLQRINSVSLTNDRGLWVGTGFTNPISLNDYFSLRFSFLPGIYVRGTEVDLGGWLMFRSVAAVELTIASDIAVSVAYDHRSSGDIWSYNPGLETWQFQVIQYFD